MVVMLIVSIVLAAMAPVMTTKMKREMDDNSGSSASIWQWIEDRTGIYFSTSGSEPVMVGQKEFGATDPNALLILNTDESSRNHILFKTRDDVLGRLILSKISDSYNLILGDFRQNDASAVAIGSSESTLGVSSLAFGQKVVASGNSSTALGNRAEASGSSSTAVGFGADATNRASVALGIYSKGYGKYSIAIGIRARTATSEANSDTSDSSIAIGADSKAMGAGSIAIGEKANTGAMHLGIAGDEEAHEGAIAIGRNTRVDANNSIAIGDTAKGYSESIMAIGTKANVSADNSIAIGIGAIAGVGAEITDAEPGTDEFERKIHIEKYDKYLTNEKVLVIGTNARASGSRTMAIGNDALVKGLTTSPTNRVNTTNSLLIGNEAQIEYSVNSTVVGNEAKITKYINSSGHHSTTNAVVIGYKAQAGGDDWGSGAIAIGAEAKASGRDSIAIGAGVIAKNQQVVLGHKGSTVYIPGNLVVDGDVAVAVGDGKKFITRVYETSGSTILYGKSRISMAVSEDWNGDDDNFENVFEKTTIGDWTFSSDRRLKYVGKESKDGLDKIRQLKVFNYTFKKDEKKIPRVGVIAQDLQKVFPNAVKKGSDGFLTIRMEDMFYAVVNAVKELDMKVTELLKRVQDDKIEFDTKVAGILKQVQNDRKDVQNVKKEIQALKNENRILKEHNKALDARLKALEAKIK